MWASQSKSGPSLPEIYFDVESAEPEQVVGIGLRNYHVVKHMGLLTQVTEDGKGGEKWVTFEGNDLEYYREF
jgi:hypothetical protein